jgi:hypothetical protein
MDRLDAKSAFMAIVEAGAEFRFGFNACQTLREGANLPDTLKVSYAL